MSVWEEVREKAVKEGGDEWRNSKGVLEGRWKAPRPNPGEMVSLSF